MLTFRLMRSLAFNSVEDEDGIYCEGTKDFIKWRVRIYYIYLCIIIIYHIMLYIPA